MKVNGRRISLSYALRRVGDLTDHAEHDSVTAEISSTNPLAPPPHWMQTRGPLQSQLEQRFDDFILSLLELEY